MPYTISLAASDKHFQANSDEPILAAAKRQNLNLPHSCQNGICGQCKAEVVSGEVEQWPHSNQALREEDEAEGKILMCCCVAKSDVALKIAGFNPNSPVVKTLPARVSEVIIQDDVAALTLALPKAPPFIFWAGQYIDILLRDNKIRSYSIANSPARAESLTLHIRRREGGLFSEMLFGDEPTVKVGVIMRMRGPLGTFTLSDSNKPIIMLATGTGYAPIRSLLQHLIDSNSQRSVHLYWGARYESQLYKLQEAADLVAQLPNGRFTPVLSRPDNSWQGGRGHVQAVVKQDYVDLSNHEVYACGSSEMIEAAQKYLEVQCALPAESFFSDAFSPAV